MKRTSKPYFQLAGALWLLFILFTICVACIDVKPIGPEESEVGFAALNQFVFQNLGVHPVWYAMTEWLGVAALLVALGFAAVGLYQLIRRKSIRKVDRRIMALGFFYGLVLACYLFFEQVVINYRPVILGDGLEASYPSSHTMLVVCIMATAVLEVRALWPDRKTLYCGTKWAAVLLSAVTVVGRLLSGVHWFTDIVGGILLSAALVVLYRGVIAYMEDIE